MRKMHQISQSTATTRAATYLVPKRAEANLSRKGSGFALLCSKCSESDGGSFGGLLSGFGFGSGSGSASAVADAVDASAAAANTTVANRKWHFMMAAAWALVGWLARWLAAAR